MRYETVNGLDMPRITGSALIVGVVLLLAAVLLTAPPLAGQEYDMSFFVVLEGPTWGTELPAVGVADTHCQDLGYAQGFGHLAWRAYLTGTGADGEENEIARERIGTGPWYNYYGVMIAQDLFQLHSDDNNLWLGSAFTVTGDPPPEGLFEIPWGSELDGRDFSREGPFFCFGFPG